MDGISLRRRRNSTDRNLQFGYKRIPQADVLHLLEGSRRIKFVSGFGRENDWLHGRRRRQSAKTCSAGMPLAAPL